MKRIVLLSYILIVTSLISLADIRKVKEDDGFIWYKVTENGKYGRADQNGNIIIPVKYDLLVYYSSKYFGGYIDYGGKNQRKSAWTVEGDCVISEDDGYEEIYKQNAGSGIYWLQVVKNGLEGACSVSGEEIIKPAYDGLIYSIDGFNYKKNGKWLPLGITFDNYVARNGNSNRGNDYSQNSTPRNNNSSYSNSNVSNNYHGSTDLPLDDKHSESNGFSWYKVSKNGLYGAADENGNLLIPIKYDLLVYYDSYGGYFGGYINYGGRNQIKTVWDLYGNCVIPESRGYSEIVRHQADKHVHYYSVERGSTQGACDAYGKEIIKPEKQYSESLFYSSVDGFNTQKGKSYIPLGITLDLSTPTYSDNYIPARNNSRPRQNSYAQNNSSSKPNSSVKNNSSSKRPATTSPASPAKLEKFSTYAQRVVTEKVKAWQEKGEFETTTEWHARVNEESQKRIIDKLINDARKEYLSNNSPGKIRATLGKYDADKGVFPIKTKGKGTIYAAVPRAEAPTFKSQWTKVSMTPTYGIIGDTIAILSCNFKLGAKSYKTATDYVDESNSSAVAENLPKIEINFSESDSPKNSVAQASQKKKIVVDHKVDVNIPVNKTDNTNTFAVIIGNENYQSVAKVPYAANDAKVFAEYCNKTLGIPQKNIKTYQDASYGKILSAIKYLNQVSSAFQGNINIIFYYAGHGIPNEIDKSAYLLPIDADGTQTEVCYGIDRLYSDLSQTKAKSVVIFLDACFSGAQRGSGMVADARGVAIKPRVAEPSGNMVVMTAATGNQTAYPYDEKGHGMFTYFILDKLQNTRGNVTLKELGEYVKSNVQQQSIVINAKTQTPTITPSTDLSDWQNIKLR